MDQFLARTGAIQLTFLAGAELDPAVMRTQWKQATAIGRVAFFYTTFLMSTGLTFGTTSALFGSTRGIVTQAQYLLLIAAAIGSAVMPTLIANAFFLPHHLFTHAEARTVGDAEEAKPHGAAPKHPGLSREAYPGRVRWLATGGARV